MGNQISGGKVAEKLNQFRVSGSEFSVFGYQSV